MTNEQEWVQQNWLAGKHLQPRTTWHLAVNGRIHEGICGAKFVAQHRLPMTRPPQPSVRCAKCLVRATEQVAWKWR